MNEHAPGEHRTARIGLTYSSDPAPEAYDQRAIAEMNNRRRPSESLHGPGSSSRRMFLLPLIYPLLGRGWHMGPVICMTAAWAVLVSATSFAAMASTKPGDPRGCTSSGRCPSPSSRWSPRHRRVRTVRIHRRRVYQATK